MGDLKHGETNKQQTDPEASKIEADYGRLRRGDYWLMSVGGAAILLIAWFLLIMLMTLGE